MSWDLGICSYSFTNKMKLPEVIKQIAAGPMEVRLRVRHATGDEVDLPPMTRQEIIVPTVKGYDRK